MYGMKERIAIKLANEYADRLYDTGLLANENQAQLLFSKFADALMLISDQEMLVLLGVDENVSDALLEIGANQ